MPNSFVTITIGAVEKTLASMNISAARREQFNQASDTFAFNLLAGVADPETMPYGTQIIVQINRQGVYGVDGSQPTAFTGGTRWFVGYRQKNVRTCSKALEQFSYKFAGPWDTFFELLVYRQLWLSWNGAANVADWQAQLVLGQSLNTLTGPADEVPGTVATNFFSLRQQINDIVNYCANRTAIAQASNGLGWTAGAQFQFDVNAMDGNGNYILNPNPTANCGIPDYIPGTYGTVSGDGSSAHPSGVMLRAPLDAVNNITCSQAMRKMLRWIGAIGSAVAWFDYSTTPPTLKVSTRDQLPGKSLPLPPNPNPNPQTFAGLTIERRDDLIPQAVDFTYRQIDSTNGQSVTAVYHDVAAYINGQLVEGIGLTGALKTLAGVAIAAGTQTTLVNLGLGFGVQSPTFDFAGLQVSYPTTQLTCEVFEPSSEAWWLEHAPKLNDPSYNNTVAFSTLNPTITIVDKNGVAIDPTQFSYVLLDSNIPPWITASGGGPVSVVEATVTANFSYNTYGPAVPPHGGQLLTTVPSHAVVVQVKLTEVGSGTYTGPTQGSTAEPLPFGLAGYILAIDSIAQYEGSYLLQETDVTDPCPMGYNLNLTGGLAEWVAMNACIQNINYDVVTGETEIRFGTAQHLGAGDLIERLRVTWGYRDVFLFGSNQTNNSQGQSNIEIGGATPTQSSDSAAPTINYVFLPADPSTGNLSNAGITQDPVNGKLGVVDKNGSGVNLTVADCNNTLLEPVAVPCCENFVEGYRMMVAGPFTAGALPS